MRILFTGGGTGGHFYPIISIAEAIHEIAREKKLVDLELYYMSHTPYDAGVLYENGIIFTKNSAGKLRRYFSIKNFLDLFKTGWGIIVSVYKVYKLYPDVVFGKGGYASFPALLAARILRIPIVIHESDTVPGRVSVWAGKRATRVAVSYKESMKYFPQDKVALTGNPVRKDISMPITSGAREFLKIEKNVPLILVLGGSQGAEKINNALVEGLKKLVEKNVIIHQVGKSNIAQVKAVADVILADSPYKNRYKPFGYLDELALRMAAGAASVVISRAGSTIFEIASWGRPSIIIPITKSNGDHQRQNAFAYAKAGGCEVIEEANLTPNIIASEIERLVTNKERSEEMSRSAKAFFKPDAARLVATEILKIALEHESR